MTSPVAVWRWDWDEYSTNITTRSFVVRETWIQMCASKICHFNLFPPIQTLNMWWQDSSVSRNIFKVVSNKRQISFISLKMSELNCPVCATTVNSSHSYYGGKGVCSSCRTFFRRSGEAKLWSLVLQQPIDTDCTAVVMYTRIEILCEYKAHSKWLVCHQDL